MPVERALEVALAARLDQLVRVPFSPALQKEFCTRIGNVAPVIPVRDTRRRQSATATVRSASRVCLASPTSAAALTFHTWNMAGLWVRTTELGGRRATNSRASDVGRAAHASSPVSRTSGRYQRNCASRIAAIAANANAVGPGSARQPPSMVRQTPQTGRRQDRDRHERHQRVSARRRRSCSCRRRRRGTPARRRESIRRA